MSVEINFRTQLSGDDVQDPPHVSASDLATIRAASHLVFVAHGYNLDAVSSTRACVRYCDALRQNGVNATLVRVLWPGTVNPLPALNYARAQSNANGAGAALSDFIQRECAAGAMLDFVGNSLGNRVALVAMKRLQGTHQVNMASSIYVALAAAIGSTHLADQTEFQSTVANITRTYVTVNDQDGALGGLFPGVDQSRGQRNAALGFEGPQDTTNGTGNVPVRVKAEQVPSADNFTHDDLFAQFGPLGANDPPLNAKQQRSAKWVADRLITRTLLHGAP